MRYQGVLLLSVRTYLGVCDGVDTWQYLEHIVGIEENGKVKDYKTGEEYDLINRDERGNMLISRAEIKKGHTYAVEAFFSEFNKNKTYHGIQIDYYIKHCNLFSDEYKNIKKVKRGKMLIK